MARSMDIQIIGDDKGVQKMMRHFDTVLNPVSIAAFLGGAVDPYLRKRARDRFASEGDDVVGAWVPLASSTQQIRATMGYGASGPINRRTDQLRDYIVDAPNQLTINPFGATLQTHPKRPGGELGKKVKTAQKGSKGSKGQRPTPARPVSGINERDLTFILLSLATTIKGRRR